MERVLNHGLFQVVIDDPSMRNFNDQIRQRYERYLSKKRDIEAQEGSLSQFASGFQSFGVHKTATGIIYHEWAPGAEVLYLVFLT